MRLHRVGAGSAAFAVADQGLASGTHLVVHVLAARWMPSESYGMFALAFSAFQLAQVLHSATVSEPPLVLAYQRFRGVVPSYFQAIAAWQIMLIVGACGVGLAITAIGRYAGPPQGGWLDDIAAPLAATVAMLTVPIARRRWYVQGRPEVSALVGAVYLSATGLILAGLKQWGTVSPNTVWLAMGLAGCVAGIPFCLAGTGPLAALTGRAVSLRTIVREHWDFGRWLLMAGLLGFLASGLNPLLLTLFLDLSAAAEYRAVLNLAMPGLQGAAAITLLFLPSFSRMDTEVLRGASRRLALAYGACFTAYGALILIVGSPMMSLLYGPGTYSFSGFALLLIAILPLSYLMMGVGGVVIKAAGDPRWLMHGSLIAGIVASSAGLVLVPRVGVDGALLASVLGYVVGGGFLWGRRRSVVRPQAVRGDGTADA